MAYAPTAGDMMRSSVYIGRRNVAVICGNDTISMLSGNTAYCVKLSGGDLSRYSNKIESVGSRRCSYYHYVSLTKKVMSQITITNTSQLTMLLGYALTSLSEAPRI